MSSYGRLTAQEAHQLGYLPAKILLNGQEMLNVSVVDDIEGWVDVLETDENGYFISDVENGGVKIRRMYGEVQYIPNTLSTVYNNDTATEGEKEK